MNSIPAPISCRQCGQPIIDDASRADATICDSCTNAMTIAPFDPLATQMPTAGRIQVAPGIDERARFDRYVDRVEIGQWAEGKIYRARHDGLDCDVIIQTSESEEGGQTAEQKNRFLDRIKTISRINHPHLIPTMEAGIDNEKIFIVQGDTTHHRIAGFEPRDFSMKMAEGFYPQQKLVELMIAAVDGLCAIHDQGIAHGSIKQESVFVDVNGTLRLTGLIEPMQFVTAGQNMDSYTLEQKTKLDLRNLAFVFYEIATGTQFDFERYAGFSIGGLAREIRKHNSGLGKRLCLVLAKAIAVEDSAFFSSSDFKIALQQIERNVVTPPFRTRFYSSLMEILVIFFGAGLVAAFASFVSPSLAGFAILVSMIGYVFFMETIYGFTLVRGLFGLRLCDRSGESADMILRCFRCGLRFALAIVVATFVVTVGLTIGALGFADAGVVGFSAILLAPVICLFIAYLPIFIFKSRWTIYDLLSGVSWGEVQAAESGTSFTRLNQASLQQQHVFDRVDQYEIVQLAGKGGMGQVYVARDLTLDRAVAIKVLSENIANDSASLAQFKREAQLAAKIRHDNVAAVYGTGSWNGKPYIAMEYIEGKDLSQIVEAQGALSVEESWKYLKQATLGLRAADQLGIIHRDIKPANLMIDQNGVLKIMDFGISCDASELSDQNRIGLVVGTPTYMSPEQASGDEVDLRSDIYSLGLTTRYLMTARPPFAGDQISILSDKLEGKLEPIGEQVSELTKLQFEIVERMSACEKTNRYGDYNELLSIVESADASALRLADPSKRIAATLLDAFTFLLFQGIVYVLFTFWFGADFYQVGNLDSKSWAISVLSGLIPWALFCWSYFLGAWKNGQSSAKRLLNLRIAKLNGSRPSFRDAIVRGFVCVPMIVFYPLNLPLFGTEFDKYLKQSYDFIFWANVGLAIVSIVLMFKFIKGKTLHDVCTKTTVFQNAK